MCMHTTALLFSVGKIIITVELIRPTVLSINKQQTTISLKLKELLYNKLKASINTIIIQCY